MASQLCMTRLNAHRLACLTPSLSSAAGYELPESSSTVSVGMQQQPQAAAGASARTPVASGAAGATAAHDIALEQLAQLQARIAELEARLAAAASASTIAPASQASTAVAAPPQPAAATHEAGGSSAGASGELRASGSSSIVVSATSAAALQELERQREHLRTDGKIELRLMLQRVQRRQLACLPALSGRWP